MEKEFFLLS